MPRTNSVASEDEIIKRCPSESFLTPEANKPVPIRPLKRFRNSEDDGADEVERSPSPERKELSPRKLDMDQAVVLACDAASNDKEDEEDERVDPTQPVLEEEGELSPTPLVRCDAIAI